MILLNLKSLRYFEIYIYAIKMYAVYIKEKFSSIETICYMWSGYTSYKLSWEFLPTWRQFEIGCLQTSKANVFKHIIKLDNFEHNVIIYFVRSQPTGWAAYTIHIYFNLEVQATYQSNWTNILDIIKTWLTFPLGCIW